jgi:hypothetical protein
VLLVLVLVLLVLVLVLLVLLVLVLLTLVSLAQDCRFSRLPVGTAVLMVRARGCISLHRSTLR